MDEKKWKVERFYSGPYNYGSGVTVGRKVRGMIYCGIGFPYNVTPNATFNHTHNFWHHIYKRFSSTHSFL